MAFLLRNFEIKGLNVYVYALLNHHTGYSIIIQVTQSSYRLLNHHTGNYTGNIQNQYSYEKVC
jgi:hypothetical protein